MMFKMKRGIGLSYKKQGLIYFMCANFHSLGRKEKTRILAVVTEVGKGEADALFCLLTKPEMNVLGVSMKYCVSEKRLYALRKRFYEEYWKRYL